MRPAESNLEAGPQLRGDQVGGVTGAGVSVDVTEAMARAWAIALNVAYLQGEYVTPERVALARRGLAAALTGP